MSVLMMRDFPADKINRFFISAIDPIRYDVLIYIALVICLPSPANSRPIQKEYGEPHANVA